MTIEPLKAGASAESQLQENFSDLSGALSSAADRVATAVEAAKRPGMPIEVLSRVTREAPLAMLFVAFMLGVGAARRR